MTTSCRVLAALIVILCAPVCHATLISYSATEVGDARWRYEYSVSNDTLEATIAEFTIFFDETLYSNLMVAGSPLAWDSIVVQPDVNLPDSGFFDSLALGTGLLPGASLGGFLVEFDWLGVGAPGAQSFTIVDPSTFATLDSGLTSLVSDPPTGVPEPSTLGLLVLGLAGIAARRRELHIGLCV